ncbi:MAG: hypothetical protein MJY44_05775 [Bacteroidales bacterium]|nr:hypothetical protein [Bacteroidales bacterium]
MAEDKSSIGLNIVSFIIPLIGFIAYFNNRKEFPVKAKSALNWTWAGFGFALFLNILGAALKEFAN